jgi:hypothetical protein
MLNTSEFPKEPAGQSIEIVKGKIILRRIVMLFNDKSDGRE